jgi:hypothetical protein
MGGVNWRLPLMAACCFVFMAFKIIGSKMFCSNCESEVKEIYNYQQNF